MRIVFCFVGFVVFGLIVFLTTGNAVLDKAWFDSLGRWAWLVAMSMIIADIVVPIPITLVITLMGQTYGPVLGGVIGTIGSFAAGVISYGVTRLLGRKFAIWLLADELEAAERFFDGSGSFTVACSRWLPLLPEAISCMAGLVRMPFGKYCMSLLCGSVPMCFGYAGLATVSQNDVVPLVISIFLPVPIWWIAGKLLGGRQVS